MSATSLCAVARHTVNYFLESQTGRDLVLSRRLENETEDEAARRLVPSDVWPVWVSLDVGLIIAKWVDPELGRWLAQQVPPQQAIEQQLHAAAPVDMAWVKGHQLPAIRAERDLHAAVVREIRKRFPAAHVLVPGMPRMSIDDERKLYFQMGYTRGQPDLLVPYCINGYVGLAIEFKHPTMSAPEPTEAQAGVLVFLQSQGWKTIVSNYIFHVMSEVEVYFGQQRRPDSGDDVVVID